MAQMAEFITNFVNEFHNVQGITIAERQTNLQKLFNNGSVLKDNTQLLDTVVTQLQPQTHLEQLFFIEFLIYFRKYKELADEVFVKENHTALKRILNQKWFFELTLSESGPEFIIQIVSILSYNLTFKVLRKITPLLKDEHGNGLFDSLLEIYGISLAQYVLTSCSCGKIRNILKSYHLILRHDQLKSLFDKDPHLICLYLEEREKHEGNKTFMDFNPIFHYIARKDLNIFQDLNQKYGFKVKLGKRITKKFVMLKRVDILTHPELYVKNLHPRSLIKGLGSDFNNVYLKLFPKKIEDSPSSESARLLKYYPKRARYNLLLTTYNQVFARKLEERPHLIDEYLLQMVPNSEERERLAKLQKDDADMFLKYYSPAHCFQITKDRINFARYPYERSNHVAVLVESCIVDNNYSALLNVAKFVTERFKNDSVDVQQTFIQVLLWQKCDFNQLTEEHWNEIKKITARPGLYSYDYSTVKIFYKYIEFLTKLKNPIEDEIVDFYTKKDFVADHVAFIKSPRIQKTFLITFIEIVPKVITTHVENLDCKLLAACQKYNLQNPKQPIQVLQYPRLLQSVRSIVSSKTKNEETSLPQALQIFLCSEETTQDLENLREEFWANLQFATPAIMKWFLKYRPEIVQRNLNKFLAFAIKNSELVKDKKLWLSLQYYSHLNIDAGTVQFLTRDVTPLKCHLLSYISSEKDFLSLVESYKPTTFKVDGIDAHFNIQRALLNSVKNIKSPTASLLLLLKFCSGDYTPFCLGPLYSIVFDVPKNQLEPLIDEMKVRLTKHAYYLTSLICNKQTVVSNLKNCQLEQCIKISFKYFLNNSSDVAWELFTTKLSTINTVGSATLKLIASKEVPTKYKAQHFETVWTVLHQNNNKYKNLLLKNISKETLLGLQYDFLHKLVETELFYGDEIHKPFSMYLIASSKTPGDLDLVGIALEKYKASSKFSITHVNNFIAALFKTYMGQSVNNETLIDGLLTILQQMFSMGNIFEPYITLSLIKCKNQNPTDFASCVIVLHSNLVVKYGETITEIFANVLKSMIPHFYQSNPLVYEFYYYLMIHQKCISDVLLVIKLLPCDEEPEDKESCRYYDDIIQQLENLNVLSVQLHLNLYFKRYKIVENVSYYEKTSDFAINTSSWLCPGARRKIGYMYY